MNTIFDGKICSYYQDILNSENGILKIPGRNVSILDLLSKQGYSNTKQLNYTRLQPYDSKEYKESKKLLPAACFSSVQTDLTINRSDRNHLFHTGFIAFDIDISNNPSLAHPGIADEMKEFIINEIPFVAYLGRSVSNIALWGLVPIAYKDEHYAHFRALVKYFEDRNIYMDKPLYDISRLRFIAYDPDAHFELNPQVFTDTLESTGQVFANYYERKDVTIDSDEFFRAACRWIEMKHNVKFEKGQIHNYLIRLYAVLRFAHVNREIILAWIYKNLIPADQITTNCLDEIDMAKLSKS